MTILMTTHYMDEAEELADKIAIMDKGKILAMGSTDELKSMLGQDVIYVVMGNSQGSANPCSIFDFARECKELGGRIELIVDSATKSLPLVFSAAELAGLKISEVSYKRPTLNEVFLHLTGRELRDSLENQTNLPRRRWRWV